jgi:hypothetical protein
MENMQFCIKMLLNVVQGLLVKFVKWSNLKNGYFGLGFDDGGDHGVQWTCYDEGVIGCGFWIVVW